MGEMWLLCEGDSDAPVLDGVLTSVLASGIVVKPSGGVSNSPSAAEYVARHHRDVSVSYVVDRDYHRRDVADASFTDGRRGFMWRRHGIESYLLAPAVVAAALRAFKTSMAGAPPGVAAWVNALPEDEGVIAQGLRAAAALRAPQEAMRLAVHRLWEDLSDTAGRVQKRVPSVPNAANPDVPACRQALIDEAARLATKSGESAASQHLLPVAVGARFDAELQRVTDATYLVDLRFLEEFDGKDLLRELGAWLRAQHGSRLGHEMLVKELVKAVPVAYRANRTLYGTDDFLELANGVRVLGGEGPIR